MTFTEWQAALKQLQEGIDKRRSELDFACVQLSSFLEVTVGVKPGDIATVEATAKLISQIVDMKEHEKGKPK